MGAVLMNEDASIIIEIKCVARYVISLVDYKNTSVALRG